MGISPWNPSRVLRTISDINSSSPSPEADITTSYLISSSPPDATTLRFANQSFTEAVETNILTTPI